MTPRYTENRLPTAYHEAGHAVVDYDYGHSPVRSPSSRTTSGGAEGSSQSEDWTSGLGESHTEEDVQEAIQNYVVGLYAGREAQLLVDPDGDALGSGDDEAKAQELAETGGLGKEDLETLRERAADHVSRRRDAIDRLARTLLVFGTLNQTQAECVIDEAPFHERNEASSPLYTAHMSGEALARHREEARRPLDWSKLDEWASKNDSSKRA